VQSQFFKCLIVATAQKTLGVAGQLQMDKMRADILRLFLYLLLVCVALEQPPRAQCTEYQWSGFVNSFRDPIDFSCPDDQVVVGLASDFRSVKGGRRLVRK